MTESQLRILLETIRTLALLPYTFTDGTPCDTKFAFALGQIAGIASKAIVETTSMESV